ncbi:hypothetical protein ADIS_3862 [Lunatimonas lonarensis]|uniref:Uncharacterized protein n=1 Tax=Lunatimonas lonarensis TaxID=1232681 RepID=R7ZNJ3_9BACT|nr:hypothetical protein ADIS_3862 [Lunatimonas lonarensis]
MQVVVKVRRGQTCPMAKSILFPNFQMQESPPQSGNTRKIIPDDHFKPRKHRQFEKGRSPDL